MLRCNLCAYIKPIYKPNSCPNHVPVVFTSHVVTNIVAELCQSINFPNNLIAVSNTNHIAANFNTNRCPYMQCRRAWQLQSQRVLQWVACAAGCIRCSVCSYVLRGNMLPVSGPNGLSEYKRPNSVPNQFPVAVTFSQSYALAIRRSDKIAVIVTPNTCANRVKRSVRITNQRTIDSRSNHCTR
jgi:hypothetical protein